MSSMKPPAISNLRQSDTFEIAPERYRNHGLIASGMTGRILQLSPTRVVKIARIFPSKNETHDKQSENDFTNATNRETLINEKAIFDRLGKFDGIINCFVAFDDGIELEFANQGDLRSFIRTTKEPHESVKIAWIQTLARTMSYIHSRKVFIDEIALRNILVHNGQLKITDFGQSILLREDADMDTVCEQDLTTKIEILHLGWIIYSISVWQVHEFYFFDKADTKIDRPSLQDLLFADTIENCWEGRYVNMEEIEKEIFAIYGN